MDTHFSHDGMQEPTVSGDEFGERSIAGRVAPRKHEASDEDLRRAVDYVVDECFFAVGQAVGTRKTLSYEAVVWWREHYRAKFLKAMQRFGNRWAEDRDRVSAVGFMLAERATRYAGDATAIDLSVRSASTSTTSTTGIHGTIIMAL